jgi:decaprenyl-phosphate phosphoribosyltransferase
VIKPENDDMDKLFQVVILLRPKEWVKNIFVFAPLFFTPHLLTATSFVRVLLGALIFSLVASSVYALNDIKDYQADRLHPLKKNRPIASNRVSVRLAGFIFVVLSIVSLVAAFFLSHTFFNYLLAYYVINIAYCFTLKYIAIIDVYCVAAGFILRVISGAVLINVTPSIWILMCAGLLSLFLALAKRRDDIVRHLDSAHRKSIAGYNKAFIDSSIVIVLSGLFIAYTIYCGLSISTLHLGTAHFYWTVPLVLLGILRYLQLMLVEEKSGSPTHLLLSDLFLLLTVAIWAILSAILMY